ncbi:cupredoxin family copper-binding protein [Streptomyces sp. S.PNR 29]|uniref:cupredoxin domain-containing protein n=1 Tax=Streptomyces sp. S.PNR 29 TaxID=2973805 RepID=UPI0025B15E2E|nr:cupredoxin family copper-binding protein [Streptomyces sp. S.PNR 29]MDN0200927.1 cupredoxin family copper-binding protein [Streptomyces sp. S.PNR 29]
MRAARRAAAVLAVLLPLLPAVPGQASAAGYQVTMQGYAFAPATLTVPAGSTVTWTNQDTAPHDVKTTSGPVSIHSPMLSKGQSWSFTFTTAGSYGYYCTVHPNMTARIVVRAAAPATSAAPTHEHTGSSSGSSAEHQGTGHQGTVTHRPTATAGPARSPSASTTSPAAAAPQTASPPAQAAQAPQAQTAASTARPLDPLLVLAGIVAGVAVLCLLLVGSRAAAPRREGAVHEEP